MMLIKMKSIGVNKEFLHGEVKLSLSVLHM